MGTIGDSGGAGAIGYVDTLKGALGPGTLAGMQRSVIRTSLGQIWYTDYFRGAPRIYDSAGRFVRRIGTTGSGPGEYEGQILLRLRGDSVYVADGMNGRISVVSVKGEAGRSLELPVPDAQDFLPLRADGYVLNVALPTASGAGFPLHFVSDEGKVRSSGGDELPYTRRTRTSLNRVLAVATESTFWSGDPNEYVIREWDARGVQHRELRRSVAWFPPHMPNPGMASRDDPWRPRLSGIQQDSAGLVWVLIQVPDARWQQALRPGTISEGKQYYNLTDYNEYLDTIIEVIDPRTDSLVTSRRFDTALSDLLDAGHGAGFVYHDDRGVPRIALWRIRLTNPSPKGD